MEDYIDLGIVHYNKDYQVQFFQHEKKKLLQVIIISNGLGDKPIDYSYENIEDIPEIKEKALLRAFEIIKSRQ